MTTRNHSRLSGGLLVLLVSVTGLVPISGSTAHPAAAAGAPPAYATVSLPGGRDRLWSATSLQKASVLDRTPIYFETNRGQAAASVKFVARGAGYSVLLTPSETYVNLQKEMGARRGDSRSRPQFQRSTVRLRFLGSNANVKTEGLGKQPGSVNYFEGRSRSQWLKDVPTYSKVKYVGIYPGIDAVFYGAGRHVEHDLIVAPGADPGQVRVSLDDSTGKAARISADGGLELRDAAGSVTLSRPVAYQVVDGVRRSIESRYVRRGARAYGVAIGRYDHSRPMVIDPVLEYSSYLGGGGLLESGNGIATDANGSVYIAGGTDSTNFPTLMPVQQMNAGFEDAFVTRLDPVVTGVAFTASAATAKTPIPPTFCAIFN